jgi:hypothetical protein
MGKTLVGRVGAVEERRSIDRAWKKSELSTTVELGTTRRQGVEKGQRRPTRQGGADPRRLNNNTGAQGKKREGKRENGDGEGVRDGSTRRRGRGEEGEDKVSPPSPRQNRTKAVEEPHWEVEGTQRKKSSLRREKRAFGADSMGPDCFAQLPSLDCGAYKKKNKYGDTYIGKGSGPNIFTEKIWIDEYPEFLVIANSCNI